MTATALASWGAEEVVAETGAPEEHDRAIVRVRGDDGSAVAAWLADTHGGFGALMVARRRTDGRWTTPVQLGETTTRGSHGFDLAVGPRGSATVVWQQHVGDRWRVVASHLLSRTWVPAQPLGTGTRARVTIDRRGTSTVVWPRRGIRSARGSATRPWRFERVTRTGGVRDLRVDSNSDGDVVVAWRRGDLVSASVRSVGVGWGAPGSWRPDPRDFALLTGVQAAIDSAGRALVTWSVTNVWHEAEHDYANYVAWSRSTRSGGWGPSQMVTRSLGEEGGGLSLSMNASGDAVAAWIQVFRTGSPPRAWAARFRPDGTWGPPLLVTLRQPRRLFTFVDQLDRAHVLVRGSLRVTAVSQAPNSPWGEGRTLATGHLFDAGGGGQHLIALYVPRADTDLRAVARE